MLRGAAKGTRLSRAQALKTYFLLRPLKSCRTAARPPIHLLTRMGDDQEDQFGKLGGHKRHAGEQGDGQSGAQEGVSLWWL